MKLLIIKLTAGCCHFFYLFGSDFLLINLVPKPYKLLVLVFHTKYTNKAKEVNTVHSVSYVLRHKAR